MKEPKKKDSSNPNSRVNSARSKPVIAIDGWGRETRYPSGREAARQLGLNQSGVTYILAGKRKKTGGYRFRYADPE